jgi:hypothetical protein
MVAVVFRAPDTQAQTPKRNAERDLRCVGRWIRLGFLRRARKIASDARARHGSDPRFGMYELFIDPRLGAIPHEAALQRLASMGMPPTKTTSKGDRSPRPPSPSRLGNQSLSPGMPTRVIQQRTGMGLQLTQVGFQKFGVSTRCDAMIESSRAPLRRNGTRVIVAIALVVVSSCDDGGNTDGIRPTTSPPPVRDLSIQVTSCRLLSNEGTLLLDLSLAGSGMLRGSSLDATTDIPVMSVEGIFPDGDRVTRGRLESSTTRNDNTMRLSLATSEVPSMLSIFQPYLHRSHNYRSSSRITRRIGEQGADSRNCGCECQWS